MQSPAASSELRGVDIRRAVSDDLARIAEIARLAYRHYIPRIGREPAPIVADFALHLARDELDVAVSDAGVDGYIVAYPRPDDYFVENVAVDPAGAGRGTGRALMQHAEAAARRAGRTAVRLYTNVHMTENFPFYAALGYRKTHAAEEDGFQRVYFEKVLEQL